jgi:chromosome partitioning protein
MRVGSGPGLGWPEESLPTGGDGPAASAGGPAKGLGWPGIVPNGSSGGRAASAGTERLPADECWTEYIAGPGQERAPEATADGEPEWSERDEPDDDWTPAPDRVRQALAGVSRETATGPIVAEAGPNPAADVQAAPSPDSVGGAEDAIAGESEVQVAIPAVPDAVADTPIARAAQAAVVARSGGAPWPRPSACRTITIANQKGGVGKTTTAVNMAASLAMHGARVLVVDLDPQGNASTALDVDHRSGMRSVYNVLVDGQPLDSVVNQVSGFPQLYCAPAAIDLAGAEIELVPLVAREARLSRALAAYDASNLDYIFIDCPPSLGLLTVNALVAAPEVLIPIQCEYYALEGLEQLLRTIDLVRSHLNPILSVTTILLTMYDGRTRLAAQVADEVREHFGAVVLSSVIPRSVRVSEAPSYGQSVMTYDPGSTGALAYLEAARELAQRNAAPAAS